VEPGVIMYDTLAAGEIKEDIDIKVYTDTIEGTEIVNLRVASMGDPSLRDSINVYVTVAAGIEEREDKGIQNSMLQVYPNPFSKNLIIRYTIHDTGFTEENFFLVICDVSGRIVRDLTNNLASCILHHASKISWDGTDEHGLSVSPGVYFLRFKAGDYKETKKLLLLR